MKTISTRGIYTLVLTVKMGPPAGSVEVKMIVLAHDFADAVNEATKTYYEGRDRWMTENPRGRYAKDRYRDWRPPITAVREVDRYLIDRYYQVGDTLRAAIERTEA